MGFVNEEYKKYKWRTIDKGRGYSVQGLGVGVAHESSIRGFRLDLPEGMALLELNQEDTSLPGSQVSIDTVYNIYVLAMPETLPYSEEEIQEILTEAFEAMGWNPASASEKTNSVTVNFDYNYIGRHLIKQHVSMTGKNIWWMGKIKLPEEIAEEYESQFEDGPESQATHQRNENQQPELSDRT